MIALSPEAQKTRLDAAAQSGLYLPKLLRNTTKALVYPPRMGSKHHKARFQWFMRDNLPQFTWNSHPERQWWEAPLDQIQAAHDKITRGGYTLELSNGAKAHLAQNVDDKPPVVILEYRFNSFDAPDDNSAHDVIDVTVVEGEIIDRRNLSDIRLNLKHDYQMISQDAKELNEHGRFCPLWRETWRKRPAQDEVQERRKVASKVLYGDGEGLG